MSRSVPKEYLGAFKRGHRQASKEFIDDEFSHELLKKAEQGDEKAIKALQFLTRFNNEYHKNVLKKGDPNALHASDAQRKECYARTNRVNRDAMNVHNGLVSMEAHALHLSKLNEMIDEYEIDEAHPWYIQDGLK